MSYTPHIDRVILGQPERSVESLLWCNGRLFSSGLNAMIVEYDLMALLPKVKTYLYRYTGIFRAEFVF